MIIQKKNATLLEQHGVSKVTSFPKLDNQNAHSLPAKCKAWVIALALAGRISFGTATRLVRWLGLAHV